MRDNVTIAYRGANYEIGRGPTFYGIWVTNSPQDQALEWWPSTPAGWYSAWARFIAIEAPQTIVPVGSQSAPRVQPPPQFAPASLPEAQATTQPAPSTGQWGQPPTTSFEPFATEKAPIAPTAAESDLEPGVGDNELVAPGEEDTGIEENKARASSGSRFLAAGLLAIGVIGGIVGLFPHYLDGASLSQEPPELVPHVIYFATWAVSAVLILLGGDRLRVGALLALGTSVVTFGFYFADAGTAIASGAHVIGAGLVLGLLGWLACFAGSATAFALRGNGDTLARPRGPALVPFLALSLAAIGAAAAFAPSWDSYVFQTAAGTTSSFTQGNVFSNPAPVIAGNLAVMIGLVAVVMVAGLWRPIRHGGVLLAGAIVPLVAEGASAIVQLSEGATPATFGISAASAQRAGLTITMGLTLVFWIYCIFVVALIVMGASSLISTSVLTTTELTRPEPQASGPYTAQHVTSTPSAVGPFGPLTPDEG